MSAEEYLPSLEPNREKGVPGSPNGHVRPSPVFEPAYFRSKLTVVETVYHQGANRQPTSTDSRYSRYLETDDQPYSRTVTLDEAWKVLDIGWFAERQPLRVRLLVIQNEEGKYLAIQPTDLERLALKEKVVEVSVGGISADWEVLPGESLRGSPSGDPRRLRLRSRSGKTRCTYTLYPP